MVSKAQPKGRDHWVSALIRPRRDHTVAELKRILEGSDVEIREIVPGVLTFDGYESVLELVSRLADISINIDHQMHPDFF